MRDLPGQTVMFPELEAPARPLQAACAAEALRLPKKPTCTPGEAAACIGISKRQIRYYVYDGTLLAINAARVPVGKAAGKGARRNKLDRWRIVVRRSADFAAESYTAFLTLEEFVRSRFNTEAT